MEGAVLLYSLCNRLRFCHKSGRKWLSYLSIMLLLMSLFPATVLGDSPATMTIKTSMIQIEIEPPLKIETPLTESIINDNEIVIELILNGNEWAEKIDEGGGIDPMWLPALRAGFETKTDADQWNSLLNKASKFKLATTVEDNDTIEITIPKLGGTYDILSDQTVTFTPPVSLLQDLSKIPTDKAPYSVTIGANPQATLSGSLITGAKESSIASGGEKLIITLYNCQWAEDVATIATKRMILLEALKFAAPEAEAEQWNTDVCNALITDQNPNRVLIRNNSQTVTITLPEVSKYSIDSSQKITFGGSKGIDYRLLTDMDGTAYNESQSLLNIINKEFTIQAEGSISLDPLTLTESTIAGATLTLTLSSNTWASDIDKNSEKQKALLAGFTTSTDTAAWDNVKTAILKEASSFKLSSTSANENPPLDVLSISIPKIVTPSYSISSDQLVTVNVPSEVLAGNTPLSTSLSFTITADPSVAIALSETNVTEIDIANGKKGINITASLTNDTWDPLVTENKIMREQLIDDLLFPEAPAAWPLNALETIKEKAKFVLSSDLSAVTITLPAVPGFNILSDLKIPSRVPSTTITSSPVIEISSPPFTIFSVNNQSASISGTVTTATESDIVVGGKTLVISLKNDVWVQDVASNNDKLVALSGGISYSSKSIWTLSPSDVVRTSDSVLTITLPPVAGYALDQDQTINVTIPWVPATPLLTTSDQEITAGSFTVKAVTATLSGTAVTAQLGSSSVVAGGKTIVITLKNATWASDVATAAKLEDLLNCFIASTPSSLIPNWDNIKKYITPQNITLSGSILTIKLPQVPLVLPDGWSAPQEQITFSISDLNSSSIFEKLIKEKLSSSKTLLASSSITIGDTLQPVITASLSGSMSVSEIVQGNKTITITLFDGIWDPKLLTDSAKFNALVNGFKVTSDSISWALVQSALKNANLNSSTKPIKLTQSNVLDITLPAVPAYDPLKDQTVSLTIPKTVLVSATTDVTATGSIQISMPSTTSLGTLQSLLGDGSLANYVNTVPLRQIFLVVPTKYLTSVITKQVAIGNTTITSLDIYTDSTVASVNVSVDGTDYPSNTYETYKDGRKFNAGIAIVSPTTIAPDALISVLDINNNKLQSDVTIKLSSSKTYSLAPTTDLSGKYSLYKLVNTNSLLTNILKYYVPDDITVEK